MTNDHIAQLLRNIAAAYAIKDEKKFRFQIIAYGRAADTVENATTQVKDLYQEGKLEDMPGIGTSLRGHLEELFKTGKVSRFDWAMEGIPQSVFPLLHIPSFGPKKAFKLVTHFKLNDPETVITDLEKLALDDKIASLEGFGKKSQEDILQAIASYKQGVNKTVRMVLPFANELAERIIKYLTASPHVLAAYPLGSLRRKLATIGDVDIAVSTKHPEEVLKYFTDFPYKERILERGEATAGLLVSGGKHIDLMVQPPERFGSLLQHFTGSKQHNVHLREVALKKGLSLSEYGIKEKDSEDERTAYDTEEKFYKALGMQWIPPEMREDTGEIELALEHKLPTLVEISDIKADFHLHSSFPIEPSHDMGRSSMEVMIEKALSLQYQYLAFSEHNPSVSKHTSDETYALLLKRSNLIAQLNKKYTKSIRVLSFLETDILADGNLAIDGKALSLLDGTLVSIHSSFGLDKKAMTDRVIQGLSHPKAKILSHPTGRLLNQRTGYELEWERLFAFCKKNNKALEINSSPLRLDLPDSLVREAIRMGVKCVIDTDSHDVSHMDMMPYGVAVARRGWATPSDILNALEYNEFVNWLNT